MTRPLPQAEGVLTDAELMHVALYAESAVAREGAIKTYGARQMGRGVQLANMAHTHVVDKAIKRDQVRA